MRTRATKAEAKVLEKLARSAAALHLYEGIRYKRNYAPHEAAKYWQVYKHEPWEMCCAIFDNDLDIGKLEQLLLNHDENIKQLEDVLMAELAEHPTCDVCNDKTRCSCTCPCHQTCSCPSFGGVPEKSPDCVVHGA